MALQKGGPNAGKVRGATILCPKKRQLKQVLAYKKVSHKKDPRFSIFPNYSNFSQKSWCSPKKKGFQLNFISNYSNISQKHGSKKKVFP